MLIFGTLSSLICAPVPRHRDQRHWLCLHINGNPKSIVSVLRMMIFGDQEHPLNIFPFQIHYCWVSWLRHRRRLTPLRKDRWEADPRHDPLGVSYFGSGTILSNLQPEHLRSWQELRSYVPKKTEWNGQQAIEQRRQRQKILKEINLLRMLGIPSVLPNWSPWSWTGWCVTANQKHTTEASLPCTTSSARPGRDGCLVDRGGWRTVVITDVREPWWLTRDAMIVRNNAETVSAGTFEYEWLCWLCRLCFMDVPLRGVSSCSHIRARIP